MNNQHEDNTTANRKRTFTRVTSTLLWSYANTRIFRAAKSRCTRLACVNVSIPLHI